MGKVKLEMKKIENVMNRKVSFTKRRFGLMKKAFQLSILCDVDIVVLVFGASGKFFQYCNGSIEDMIMRYVNLPQGERDKSLQEMRRRCDAFESALNIVGDMQRSHMSRSLYVPGNLDGSVQKIQEERNRASSSQQQLPTSGPSRNFMDGGTVHMQVYIARLEDQQRSLHAEINKLSFHSRIYLGDPDIIQQLSIDALRRIDARLAASLDKVRRRRLDLMSMNNFHLIPYQPAQPPVGIQRQNPQVAVDPLQSGIDMGPWLRASSSNSVGRPFVDQKGAAGEDTSVPAAEDHNNAQINMQYTIQTPHVGQGPNSVGRPWADQKAAAGEDTSVPAAEDHNKAQITMQYINIQTPHVQMPTNVQSEGKGKGQACDGPNTGVMSGEGDWADLESGWESYYLDEH